MTKASHRSFILLFLILALIPWMQPPAVHAAPAFPSPRGAVNDFAGVVSADYRNRMEALSREVLEKTGTSVVVAVLPALGEEELNDYANRLYSAWGIGKKGQDKGVLILLAVKERKLRIETGYGVEGILPDGLTGEIMDRYMLPHLRQGDYGMGLYNGVYAVSTVIAKDAGVTLSGVPGTPSSRRAPRPRPEPLSPLTLILVAAVVAVLLLTPQGRAMLPWILFLLLSGSGRGGGGFGGFGGGFGGFGGGSSGGGGASRGF